MIVAVVVVVAFGRATASADPEADADAAFQAAGELAANGDARAIDAYEQLGAVRPLTRWSDDAWAEAARLAENARDFPRARRDLAQVIAIGADARLVARARGSLARIAEQGGPEWDRVRAEHERLASEIYGGGNPRPALRALGELVHANPGYPKANAARLAIGLGWEQEGETGEALPWYAEAADAARAEPGQHVRLENIRALIRAGRLDDAEAAVAALDPALVDRGGEGQVRDALDAARTRAHLRLAIGVVLAVLGGLAAWRGRRYLRRPPAEVWYLAPLAVVLSLIALPGNPLAARAVRWIGACGVALAWLSGAALEARRPARAIGMVAHAAVVVLAAAGAIYLVVDHLGLLNLLLETWRGGPAMQ